MRCPLVLGQISGAPMSLMLGGMLVGLSIFTERVLNRGILKFCMLYSLSFPSLLPFFVAL
ncbi:hypothetical protein FTV88_0492 [Heliorestis convoluta]|uniref:Uncharacterized protein n=1 Tax=Heliorestis convoluta TaxID=356322 RepID=A0A5Q2MXT0_9FIRM|nr:hypothetical protein FTV88_0492 [Heliorestis convoluta]